MLEILEASFFSPGQQKALSSQLNNMTALMFRDAEDVHKHLRELHETSERVGDIGMTVVRKMRLELRSTSRKRARSWRWGRFWRSRNLDKRIEDLGKGVQLLEQPVKEVIWVRACERQLDCVLIRYG